MISPKVSEFFRAYHVKLPAYGVTRHNPKFVGLALRNIRFLKTQTQDEELSAALVKVEEKWQSILDEIEASEPAPVERETKVNFVEKPKLFSFRDYIKEHELLEPIAANATSVDEVEAQREKLRVAIESDIPDRTKTEFKRWDKEWRAQLSRLFTEYAAEERKGAAAAVIAKQKQKAREKSAAAMHKGKGGQKQQPGKK